MEKYYDENGVLVDYYKDLGVSIDSSKEVILRKANEALIYASSCNFSAITEREKFENSKRILEAVSVLYNDKTREEYNILYKKEMAKSSQENESNPQSNEQLDKLLKENESNLQSNEQLDKLLKENEDLRKINNEREEYIKELERKLSTKSNQETIDDYIDDDEITDEDIDAMINDLMDKDKDLNNSDLNSDKTQTNIKNVTIGLDSEDNKNIEQPTSDDKVENNKEENKKENDDIKPIFRDTEEPQKVIETEEVDKNSELGEKITRGSLNALTVLLIAGATLTGIVWCSSNARKRAEAIKEKAGIESESTTTSLLGVADDNTEFEENAETVETAEVPEVAEEPYEVELDINSDTVILETVDKIENEVSKLSDPVAKDMLNRGTIEALVRYTRDNTILSGETAYSLFQLLYKNGIDTSMFFENLESYQVMNTLYLSNKAVEQDNNSYDDELNAYKAIESAVTSLSEDDYAAIWNVSAITDESIGSRSMTVAAGTAVEFGGEGVEYNNEKNSVPSNVREEAKRIYNMVTPDSDSYLRGLRWNALDNENVRTLG